MPSLRSVAWLALSACHVLALPVEEPVPVFGTTVVIPSGLKGDIYFLKKHRPDLPDFEKLKVKGSIYTTELNVPPQDFKLGFPGVTDRNEWFAIQYTGKFYINQPGLYRFRLTSDDGSELIIDDQMIIDNSGMHEAQTRRGSLCLPSGPHNIQVNYFQGPKFMVALVLEVAPPGEPDYRVFNTDIFKPPSTNPADWPPISSGPCTASAK